MSRVSGPPRKRGTANRQSPRGRAMDIAIRPVNVAPGVVVRGRQACYVIHVRNTKRSIRAFLFTVSKLNLECKLVQDTSRVAFEVWGNPHEIECLCKQYFVLESHHRMDVAPLPGFMQRGSGAGPAKVKSSSKDSSRPSQVPVPDHQKLCRKVQLYIDCGRSVREACRLVGITENSFLDYQKLS